MADGVTLSAGTADGAKISTEEVTTLNGGAVAAEHVQRMLLAFRTADATAVDLPGDAANGLDVDVTRSALPTGAATSAKQDTVIGHLDGVEGLLTTIDADTGTLAGAVAGTEMQVDVVAALPAGNNNIGDVDVASEPATAADGAAGLPAVAKVVAGYDGTNVQVLVTDATGRLAVADGGGSLTVDNGGTFVTQENGALLTAAQLLDDTVFTDDAAFTPGTSKVSAIGLIADETATDSVNEGDVGAPRMTLDRKAITTSAPSATTEGLTTSKTISAASTNATSVKASAGKLYGYIFSNANAAARYLKVYDKASSPVVGTDTPILTIMMPAGATGHWSDPNGIALANGLAFALTTGIADSDTGAVSASEHAINLLYK